jgi:hypothetical protein
MGEHIQATKHVTNSQYSLYEMRISQIEVARPPLALVFTVPRTRKLTEAMKALTEAESKQKKWKAPGSTPMAPPRPAAHNATPSRPAARKPTVTDCAQVIDRKVIDKMPRQSRPR